MLFFFAGTDRKRARAAMSATIQKTSAKGARVVRITDANTANELEETLRGQGMFGSERVVVLEGIFTNEEMRPMLESALGHLAESKEPYFILEEKPDAAAKKLLGTHAKTSDVFDAPKAKREDNFFAMTGAFRAGKKKELWVLLQREYVLGKAPEMLHGALFWAAKQLVLKPRAAPEAARGKRLVAQLAELPHEARRRGESLEYALERFVLSGV